MQGPHDSDAGMRCTIDEGGAPLIRLYQRGNLLPSNWDHLLPTRDPGVPAPALARR
jgi:hypothetical protein